MSDKTRGRDWSWHVWSGTTIEDHKLDHKLIVLNVGLMQFLRDMEVIQVPTFLFIRDGNIEGKGELIGEILRYQGVRITY